MPPLRNLVGEKWNFLILIICDVSLFFCIIIDIIAIATMLLSGKATLSDPTIMWMSALGRNAMIVFAGLSWYIKNNYDFGRLRETTHQINNRMEAVVMNSAANGQVADMVLKEVQEVKANAMVIAEKADVAAQKADHAAHKSEESVDHIAKVVAEKVVQAKSEPCLEQECMPRNVNELNDFIKHVVGAIAEDDRFVVRFRDRVCPDIAETVSKSVLERLSAMGCVLADKSNGSK